MRTSNALLAGLVLATGPALAQDRSAAPDPLSSLLPNDAFFVARASSYDAFQSMAGEITQAFAPEEQAPDLAELLPADAALFAKDQPMVMAASLRGGQPVVTMILPALEPATVVAQVEGDNPTSATRTAGSYVGICDGGQYEVGNSRMLDSLQPGQIAMRLDLAPLLETFGPMIDMGMDQVRMSAQSEVGEQEMPMNIDMEAMLDLYFDGFESFMDSAETVDVGFELLNGMVTVTGALTVAEGSDMAGFGSTSTADLGPVAQRLGEGAMGTFLMGFDYADYERMFGGMMEDMLAIYPENLRGGMQAYMDGYAELLQGCEPGIGMRFDMGAGIQMAMIGQAKENSAALIPSATEMMQGLGDMREIGYSLSPVTPDEIDGVKGFRTEMKLDFEAMLAGMGEAVSSEAETEDLRQLMHVLYGGDTLPMWYGAMDKILIGAIGNGEGFAQNAVRSAKAANASPRPLLAWALGEVGNRTPSMAMELDFVTLLRQIEPLVKEMDPGAESLPEGLPASAPVAQYLLMEDLRWSMGARMPLASFGELIRTLE